MDEILQTAPKDQTQDSNSTVSKKRRKILANIRNQVVKMLSYKNVATGEKIKPDDTWIAEESQLKKIKVSVKNHSTKMPRKRKRSNLHGRIIQSRCLLEWLHRWLH